MSKSFDNTTNKLEKIWNIVEVNTENEKDLKKFQINFFPNAFTKKIITIPIFIDEDINNISNNYEYFLKDFPDWAVPMTRIIPLFTTLNESIAQKTIEGINEVAYFPIFSYWFKKESNTDYILKLFVRGFFSSNQPPFEKLPLKVNLTLYFLNEKLFNTYQEEIK